MERLLSNTRYAIGDGDGCQTIAFIERPPSNIRYAVWDGDRSEGGAIKESTPFNTCYAIRNSHGSQRGALVERPPSNTPYAIRNGHRSERGATLERLTFDTRHAIRNGHRSQRGATIERLVSNTRYAVGGAVVVNSFRDGGSSESRIVIVRSVFLIRYLYSIRCPTAGDVVVQISYLEALCPEGGGGYEGKEECEKFFHNKHFNYARKGTAFFSHTQARGEKSLLSCSFVQSGKRESESEKSQNRRFLGNEKICKGTA